MEPVCTRCQKPLQKTHSDSEIVQGICDKCLEQMISYDFEPLQHVLDSLPMPVLLVDREAKVISANTAAQKTLKKEVSSIRNALLGNVMECSYSWLPGGCGRTIHCTGCTIRQTVTETFADGLSRDHVEAFQTLSGKDGPVTMRTLISTEKVGDTIMLRIDETKGLAEAPSTGDTSEPYQQ